jgi:hypothetical protein
MDDYTAGMNTNAILHRHQPARYRLRLQGRVAADWTDWLSDPVVWVDSAGVGSITVVTGKVRDQAALFGLLTFVRDLAVPLIAVELIQS